MARRQSLDGRRYEAYATLEPIKNLLLQMFMGEKFGRDSVWESYLGEKVRVTDISMDAILGQRIVSMGDVMKLKVGSTIMLEQSPEDDVELLCGGIPMMEGKLGKAGDKKAIKVSKIVNKRMRDLI